MGLIKRNRKRNSAKLSNKYIKIKIEIKYNYLNN